MTPLPRDDAVERLLRQDTFLRGLARQLVRDAHAADDAAQATWLAAVQRGPACEDEREVRGFLATVLRRIVGRHARTERRETARRDRLDRGSAVPSPDEILARESLRAEVVRQVLALDPAQRDVVVLRFFENLPPRQVARRLGIPVETVRTRLKRSLLRLRERLDERGGGRVAWVALLRPFADAAGGPLWGPVLGPAAMAGGLGMSMQKTVTVLAAIAVLVLGWWTLVPSAGESPAPRAGDAPAAIVGVEGPVREPVAVPAVRGEQDGVVARSAVPVPASPTTGAVTVRVVRGEPAQPVPGCLVQITTGADVAFDLRRQRTGPDGTTTFADLMPQRLWAQPFPGIGTFSDEVTVQAGRTVEATIRLERVIDVDGIVVDGTGKPLADAEVLLAEWAGTDTDVACRSGVDGTFALRGIPTHCHLGARAAGRAASSLRQLAAADGAVLDVRIVLDAQAAEVHGRVVDVSGRGVPAAIVRCGDVEQRNERLADGGYAMGWRPEVTTTAADGAFALRHLPAGTHALAVRAQGLAPSTQTVLATAGAVTTVTVVLCGGVTVEGRVTDAAGGPVRAELTFGDWRDLGHRRIGAAADGTFRIDGLAVGPLAASAAADGLEVATTTIQGVAGATVTWNPVLSRGRMLHGFVVDAGGTRIADARVGARLADDEPGAYWAFVATDAEGRFALAGCPERPLRIEVTRASPFPEVVLPRVMPTADELRIELPGGAPIHIVGTVRGPDGQVLPAVVVTPHHKLANNSPAEAADATTGAFRLGPYPAGEYSLLLSASGFPDVRVAWRAVVGGETWDLGELRFVQGGDLAVAVVGDDLAVAGVGLAIHDRSGRWLAHLPCARGAGHSGLLAPGDYDLRASGETTAAIVHPFTIRGGETTRLDVSLARGTVAALSARVPAATPNGTVVEFQVFAANETLLAEPAAAVVDGVATVKIGLAAGSYRVAAAAGELIGTARLEVAAGAATVAAACALRPR